METPLLKAFDRVIGRRGYKTRSEAIRDLVRQELVRSQWEAGTEEVAATLTLVYDHTSHDLTHHLTQTQHRHLDAIQSALHLHLNERYCLEVIVLRGKPAQVRKIADSLISTRGVVHGELVSTTLAKTLT